MSTYDEAETAKNKFKDLYWKKSPDKFNIIAIDADIEYDEEKDEITKEEYSVKAYLFDMVEAANFPSSIDGVDIKYLPVFEKKETP
jgi:hypothetical protein